MSEALSFEQQDPLSVHVKICSVTITAKQKNEI